MHADRLQQAAEYVDGNRGITRDASQRRRPVELFDALVSKGYVEPRDGGVALSIEGRKFVEDRA